MTAITPAAPGETVEQLRVRFRTVGDITCTAPVESTAATPADIVIETLAADENEVGPRTPESQLLQAQTLNLIEDEIKKLPARQREAFLMRYWEDMDVAETAAAMGCSEGSVKTHCSRATHTLASALSAKGIKL